MLNEKATAILQYITERSLEGVPPTVREICQKLSIKSTSTVHRYINELVEKGYLKKGENLNRSLQLQSDPVVKVPVLGVVTAGMPILAVENIEGYVPYSTSRQGQELFALRVRGESMIKAGILDGDLIVVERVSTARNGEIVVAMIEDEATVKRFFKEKGVFRLQPENDSMQPILVREVTILGKVIALVRQYQ